MGQSNKLFYTILLIVILSIISVFVYSTSPSLPNPGHSADQIVITVNGVQTTLQQAISDGTIGGGGGGGGTSKTAKIYIGIDNNEASDPDCWTISGDNIPPPCGSEQFGWPQGLSINEPSLDTCLQKVIGYYNNLTINGKKGGWSLKSSNDTSEESLCVDSSSDKIEVILEYKEPSPPPPSKGLQTVKGTVEITAWDHEGSSEYCWFRIKVNDVPYFPASPCTGSNCILSADLDEIQPDKCHNHIQWYLHKQLLDLGVLGPKLGGFVKYADIKDYTKTVPGAGMPADVPNAEFTLVYVPADMPQSPMKLTCPATCTAFSNYGSTSTCTPPQKDLTAFASCCPSSLYTSGCFPSYET